jgi:hypothetical protein
LIFHRDCAQAAWARAVLDRYRVHLDDLPTMTLGRGGVMPGEATGPMVGTVPVPELMRMTAIEGMWGVPLRQAAWLEREAARLEALPDDYARDAAAGMSLGRSHEPPR